MNILSVATSTTSCSGNNQSKINQFEAKAKQCDLQMSQDNQSISNLSVQNQKVGFNKQEIQPIEIQIQQQSEEKKPKYEHKNKKKCQDEDEETAALNMTFSNNNTTSRKIDILI